MNIFELTVLTANQQAGTMQMYSSLIMIGIVILLFYLLILRPQKKQEKKEKEMRDNLEIGDEVVTNGGIVGIVFSIKEDTVLIETGNDRSKIRVMKWAIARNNTIHDTDEK